MQLVTNRWAPTSLIAFFIGALFLACNQPFDPRGSLDRKMVVFSVLSTDRPMQFVRVQQSYMSPGYDPSSFISDNSLTDAKVFIRASNGVYLFTDTSLARSDTNRYKFPLRAFVLNPFKPRWGDSYEVVVQSASYGLASSSVIVPGQAQISPSADATKIMSHPENYEQNSQMTFFVQLSGVSEGYIGKLLLYYDVLKVSEWVEERIEVPLSSADSSNFTLDYPIYPRLAVIPPAARVALYYKNGYYRAAVNVVNSQYQSNRILFKWATFVVLQADKNLFQYYSSTHASMDPYSTRLDEPIVATLSGGLGLVGAYSLDSTVSILPETFWGNR